MGVGKDDSGSEVSPMAVEKDSADGEASPEINKHKDPMSIDQNPVLSRETCLELINEYFSDKKVHNYFACFNSCSLLSMVEKLRIKPKKFPINGLKKSKIGGCVTQKERECFI